MSGSTVTANPGAGGAKFRTVTDASGNHDSEVVLAFADTTPEPSRVAAANPLPVKHTDGTNSMPTGDVAGRAIFHKNTDGTNTQAVKAGNTAAVSTDPAAVVVVRDAITANLGLPVGQIWKSFNATTTQTGAAIWTPASGKKIVITSIQVGVYGATAGNIKIWFGQGGGSPDTTYTEGTDQPVLKQSFAPSAAGFPGLIQVFPTPIVCANADYVLRITTDANVSVDVVVYGFEA